MTRPGRCTQRLQACTERAHLAAHTDTHGVRKCGVVVGAVAGRRLLVVELEVGSKRHSIMKEQARTSGMSAPSTQAQQKLSAPGLLPAQKQTLSTKSIIRTIVNVSMTVGNFFQSLLEFLGACCFLQRCERRKNKVEDERALSCCLRRRVRLLSFLPHSRVDLDGWPYLDMTHRLWFLAGCVARAAGSLVASNTETSDTGGTAQPRAGAKLSVEQQKQMLSSMYAAMWGFKLLVAGLVICILGLHGACCFFPNYKTSDAVCSCCLMLSIHPFGILCACWRTRVYTHPHAHTHTPTAYTHIAHTLKCTHRETHAYTYAHGHAHTNTHTHTHTHTHAHTRTSTQTHTH